MREKLYDSILWFRLVKDTLVFLAAITGEPRLVESSTSAMRVMLSLESARALFCFGGGSLFRGEKLRAAMMNERNTTHVQDS